MIENYWVIGCRGHIVVFVVLIVILPADVVRIVDIVDTIVVVATVVVMVSIVIIVVVSVVSVSNVVIRYPPLDVAAVIRGSNILEVFAGIIIDGISLDKV